MGPPKTPHTPLRGMGFWGVTRSVPLPLPAIFWSKTPDQQCPTLAPTVPTWAIAMQDEETVGNSSHLCRVKGDKLRDVAEVKGEQRGWKVVGEGLGNGMNLH